MPQNVIIFLCCGDIDHTRKRNKVGPSEQQTPSESYSVSHFSNAAAKVELALSDMKNFP